MPLSRAITLTLLGVLLAGCAQVNGGGPWTDTEKGGLFGAASGAVIGAYGHGTRGALIGAVGGGLAGAMVGRYMDHQKEDLDRVLQPERNAGNVDVTRLPNHGLKVTMTSATAFDVNSTRIKPGFDATLNKIAEVLVTYGKTKLEIVGYTDNTGSPAYNQRLSERRARQVEDYLGGRGVLPQRMSAYGLGESHPRASNATAGGRTLNRRVEILIKPIVAS